MTISNISETNVTNSLTSAVILIQKSPLSEKTPLFSVFSKIIPSAYTEAMPQLIEKILLYAVNNSPLRVAEIPSAYTELPHNISEQQAILQGQGILSSIVNLKSFFDPIKTYSSIAGTVTSVTEQILSSRQSIETPIFGFFRKGLDLMRSSTPVDIYDLKRLETIPEALHEDAIFKLYKCPITLAPTIRYVIGDPNGCHLYEKSAIKEWIKKEGNSPITRNPLSENQLVPKPAIQAMIDYLLEFYSEKLRESARKDK